MMNDSLANFGFPELKLIYHNPYNNSLGENNRIIIALVVLFCLIILFSILLKIGLLKYAKYSFDNNKLNVIDMIYCYQITVSLTQDFLVLVFKRYVNIHGPIAHYNFQPPLLIPIRYKLIFKDYRNSLLDPVFMIYMYYGNPHLRNFVKQRLLMKNSSVLPEINVIEMDSM